jgi:hypothetical protein
MDASSLKSISFVSQESIAEPGDAEKIVLTLFNRTEFRSEIVTKFSLALYPSADLLDKLSISSDFQWMSHFPRCLNIEGFIIDLGRPVILTDVEFERIVCNWALLSSLKLISCQGKQKDQHNHVFSFIKMNALVKHYPHLRTFHGFLDTRDFTEETLMQISSHCHNLNFMSFAPCSLLTDKHMVARHLHAWFPRLWNARALMDVLCLCQNDPGVDEEAVIKEITLFWVVVEEMTFLLSADGDSEASS